MLICKTADIHIGVQGKLDDTMWALNRIRNYCIEHEIKHWVNLGDLFHDREIINVRDLYAISQFLKESKEVHGIEMIIFPGNHDMFMRNSWDINSVTPLGMGNIVQCYDGVSKVVLGGVRFWILPFIHYETQYMETLAKIEKYHKPGDVLWTHIGVKSATLNTCFLLKSWSIVDFTDSKFDRVYTGHFHSQQQVGRNLWYPGSPIPFKFDEGDVDHGFYVFDTETRTHEFISIWAGATRNDPKTPPQFMTISDSTIEHATTDDIQGSIVRVALLKDYTHNQKLELKDHLEKLGAREVRWMNATSQEDKDNVAIGKATTIKASELFVKYLEEDEDGTKGLDKTLLSELNAEAVAEGDRRYEFVGGEAE